MRHILLALALALAPAVLWAAQPADADTCVCSGLGVTCANDSATNWTGCGGAAPDSNDTISCTGTSTTLNFHATSEVKNFVAQAGCAVVCNNPAPMVLTFNTFTSPPIQFAEEFFVIDGYNGGSPTTPPSFTCSGKDVVIKWKGTSASGATMILGAVGNQINNGATNNVPITLRGISRAKTNVGAFSEGLTTGAADFKDCVKYPSGFTPASTPVIGDTIVFTTGKSTDYWYRISGVGTTTECRATDCAGSTCDLEIDRAATTSSPGMVAGNRSWSSLTKVATLGGPVRVATPDDANADGTADSTNTRPATGDAFEVFLPIRIQGGEKPIAGNGATDTGGGILLFMGGVNLDMRYVELAKLSGQNTESCTTGINGPATIWTMLDNIVAAEGDIGFLNVHDYASGQGAMEIGMTKRSGDTRPNYPLKISHLYLHDSDTEISSTPCTRTGMGAGAEIVVDFPNDSADGITIDGFHCARLHTGYCFASSGSGTTIPHRNVRLAHVLTHDIPQVAAFTATADTSLLDIQAGQVIVEGDACWDLGVTSNPYRCIGAWGKDDDGALVSLSAYNVYGVNIDANAPGDMNLGSGGTGAALGLLNGTDTTKGNTISNSYFSNHVGGVGLAGNWNFNFIKNSNLEDSGGACTAARRAALLNVVSATGNVITRSSAVSCMEHGFIFEDTSQASGDFTDITRRVVSNVIANPDSTAATVCSGITIRPSLVNSTRNLDAYNNVIDFNGDTCGGSSDAGLLTLGSNFIGKFTAYYNVVGGMSTAASNGRGMLFQSGTFDENYNRCFLNDGVCNNAGNAANDIDSDALDIFDDRTNLRYSQRCDSPDRTRNPWGGPVGPIAFGIKNFGFFHPAVIPIMDADAFKRYDWRECGRSYKDLLPR